MSDELETVGTLDRLDRLAPWTFTATLYVVRWLIIIPLSLAIDALGITQGTTPRFDGPPETLLLGFIVLAPVMETLLVCTLPHAMMRVIRLVPTAGRPWLFVWTSGILMALLHVEYWPGALAPSLVTGLFLAYVYGHFASRGALVALLHTSVFHAGINIVGWTLIVLGR